MTDYGVCPVCGDTRALTRAGVMRKHLGKPYSGDPGYGAHPTPRCDGTGVPPKTEEVRTYRVVAEVRMAGGDPANDQAILAETLKAAFGGSAFVTVQETTRTDTPTEDTA